MTRPRPRVLHVDDDPAARRAVERTLGPAGFSVTGAEDGADGLAAALRGRWALVILDVDLPGMSGFEVCARIRAASRTRTVPVLHLSAARADVRDRVRGLEAGADAYLVQPVAPEELVAVARALVTRGALARPRPSAAATAARTVAATRDDALRLATHLLRAPLSALAINASSLAGSADAVSRARAAALLDAHAAAVQTLAELEELAALEASRAPLPLEPRGVGDLAAAAARRVAPAAEHAGVALQVDAAAAAAPALRCDPARLEQALEVLLRRALRTAERGGAVTVRAAAEADGVRFTVRGGRPGGDDARALLGQDPWALRPGRAGPELLGLALARAIVAAHGGRIVVDEDPAALHLEVPLSPFRAG